MKTQHENQKVIDALRDIKVRIQDGWCKYTLRNESGEVCLLGAATIPDVTNWDTHRAKMKCLYDALPTGWSNSLARYNDAPHTEKRHVLALIDKAILIAKGVMKRGDTRRPDR